MQVAAVAVDASLAASATCLSVGSALASDSLVVIEACNPAFSNGQASSGATIEAGSSVSSGNAGSTGSTADSAGAADAGATSVSGALIGAIVAAAVGGFVLIGAAVYVVRRKVSMCANVYRSLPHVYCTHVMGACRREWKQCLMCSFLLLFSPSASPCNSSLIGVSVHTTAC